jgi:tRNA dimethylallyltransferase
MGPTASGKTALALEWAAKYPCDIISVDSAMVYCGMNIGTAKPDAATLKEFPHALIDIRDPAQSYSAADFGRDAQLLIEASLAKERIPLLVGGTMLYFKALQNGLADLPVADPALRQQLEQELYSKGVEAMHQELQAIDPVAAAKIKTTDTQRIQRALEVYRTTGQAISVLQQQVVPILPYDFINLGIIPDDRAVLHERIATRFKAMLQQGFIEEVAVLKARGDLSLNLPSMRAVGYRQIWEHLEGHYGYEELVEKGVAATRQLAKRQLTWLRSWPNLQVCEGVRCDLPAVLL